MPFSVDFQALADKVKSDIDTVTRKSTLDIFSAVVARSPVDTGRFKGNWNCSRGTLDESTTETINSARGDSEASKALSFSSGDIVYLTNALPYAYRLEYGDDGVPYSKQAPAGMVRITAAEFEQYVKRVLAK